MMIIVAIFCAGSAATITAIVLNYSTLSSLWAILLSFLVTILCGIAIAAKKAALTKGISNFARIGAVFVALTILTPAARPYLELWRGAHGFWSFVFLVWLGILAFTVVSIPVQAGEEPGDRQMTP